MANTIIVARTRGRHIEGRHLQPRGAACLKFLRLPQSLSKSMPRVFHDGHRLMCWRQGARSQVASPSPDVASKRGVTDPRGVWGGTPMTSPGVTGMGHQNVASLAHAASGSHAASPDVASNRVVRCHRPMRHRRMWRQYVASGGLGLPASVVKTCLQSSGDMCTPQATPLKHRTGTL